MVMHDLQTFVNESGVGLSRALSEPMVGAILFAMGVLLIVGSLLTGEAVVGVSLGGASLALFFWGQAQAGLVGWVGIALTLIGLALIALEILVLPGFGIAGLLGGVALLAALVASVTGGNLPTAVGAERAAPAVAVALAMLFGGGGLALRFLPALARRRGLTLLAGGPTADATWEGAVPPRMPTRRAAIWRLAQHLTGEAASGEQRLATERRDSLVGARGVALADLRPGGFAQIDGERVDVITRGEVIPAGVTVQVIRDEGYRRIVRRVEPDEPEVATL